MIVVSSEYTRALHRDKTLVYNVNKSGPQI